MSKIAAAPELLDALKILVILTKKALTFERYSKDGVRVEFDEAGADFVLEDYVALIARIDG